MDIALKWQEDYGNLVLSFSYSNQNMIMKFDSRIQDSGYIELKSKQIHNLIKFLEKAFIEAQMSETDYESQRGISVAVDTSPPTD